jgi:hypothetical protein
LFDAHGSLTIVVGVAVCGIFTKAKSAGVAGSATVLVTHRSAWFRRLIFLSKEKE